LSLLDVDAAGHGESSTQRLLFLSPSISQLSDVDAPIDTLRRCSTINIDLSLCLGESSAELSRIDAKQFIGSAGRTSQSTKYVRRRATVAGV
jgi:hypothetical protein